MKKLSGTMLCLTFLAGTTAVYAEPEKNTKNTAKDSKSTGKSASKSQSTKQTQLQNDKGGKTLTDTGKKSSEQK